MKVGILGSGNVGRSLGTGFARRGHGVVIGSRHPKSQELTAWQAAVGATASTGTFAEAAKHGEIVVLAVLGSAAEEAMKMAGARNFAGKVVIDATNPLDFSGGDNPGLFVRPNDSLSERIQRALPDANVVKCFNTVPSTQMVDPKFSGGTPEMMICGDDAEAKRKVIGIVKEFGWPGAIDIGGIENAYWLEALVPLWVRVGAVKNRWDHALKVVHA